MDLLQVYARWLVNEAESRRPITLDSIASILSRLNIRPSAEIKDITEAIESMVWEDGLFIDCRTEDAIRALVLVQSAKTIPLVWEVLFAVLCKHLQWRMLGDSSPLIQGITAALLGSIDDTQTERFIDFVKCVGKNVASNPKRNLSTLKDIFIAAKDKTKHVEKGLAEIIASMLTSKGGPFDVALKQSDFYAERLACLEKAVACIVVLEDAQVDSFLSSMLSAAELLGEQLRVSDGGDLEMVSLFGAFITKCAELWPHANDLTADKAIQFPTAFVKSFPSFTSARLFVQLCSPVSDFMAVVLEKHPKMASSILSDMTNLVSSEMAARNLSIQPECEELADLLGSLIGELIILSSPNPSETGIKIMAQLEASLPEEPGPSETVTGGFHLACPALVPVLGSMAAELGDVKVSARCSQILARYLGKGPFGQRSRLFYQQLVRLSMVPGPSVLNMTLDLLCRAYLDMEGLDAASAALASAFELLVANCATDRVKTEIVSISLLGLIVQKGVRLTEKSKKNTAHGYMGQPAAALLELMLPAVTSGMEELSKHGRIQSISQTAYVEVVQEFWFILTFHGYQPTLSWPQSWRPLIGRIALVSPVLIKDREATTGAAASTPIGQVLLSQPIAPEFKAHLITMMPNCVQLAGSLNLAQCLWLLSFRECELFRVLQTDKFEVLVRYIVDETVFSLELFPFVEDLSLKMILQWIEERGRDCPAGFVDLAVSLVGLIGNVFERIHTAGLNLLRFTLSQDDRLYAFPDIWRAVWGKVACLSALQFHQHGFQVPREVADCPDDYIQDPEYARRATDQVIDFFRQMGSEASRLVPDDWFHFSCDWIVREGTEQPRRGADMAGLTAELIDSWKRQPGGPLDTARWLPHHLEWQGESVNVGEMALLMGSAGREVREAIELSMADLRACLLLTDCWSAVVRLNPSKLNILLTELLSALSRSMREGEGGGGVQKSVFSGKLSMGPSEDIQRPEIHEGTLCLCNHLEWVAAQMQRTCFLCPQAVTIFALVAEEALALALRYPPGSGRRLFGAAALRFSLRVALCMQVIDGESPWTLHFKTQVYGTMARWFEKPADWFVESKRMLGREAGMLEDMLRMIARDKRLMAGVKKQQQQQQQQQSKSVHPSSASSGGSNSTSRRSRRSTSRHNVQPPSIVLPSSRFDEIVGVFLTLIHNEHDRVRAMSCGEVGGMVLPEGIGQEDDVKGVLSAAASISVPMALCLADRLKHRLQGAGEQTVRSLLSSRMMRNPWNLLMDDPSSLIDRLVDGASGTGSSGTGTSSACDTLLLLYLPPCPPLTALAIFRGIGDPRWLNYAMRSLESVPPDHLFFYIPQITQAVRQDSLGYIEETIVHIARSSSLFAHQIIWNMQANMCTDDLGTVSDPMRPALEAIVSRIVHSLTDKAYYEREFAFFARVTGISGALKAFVKREKWEKKKKIDEELRKIAVDPGVYLPSNPESTVIDIDYESGRPLQSHAKAPFLATFKVLPAPDAPPAWQSAIFKVGDDCRQDVLSLQVLAVFKAVFAVAGLNAYVFPYRVVATAPGCGVIEVIPDSISRDQLGREKINSLHGYFRFKFGDPAGRRFCEARRQFIRSMAAYSVATYLLAIRDRHNGNIMIDDAGHLIHIDFGFILDIAPGGLRFESSPFKFSSEYLQVLGGRDSPGYRWFAEQCALCFLLLRQHHRQIIRLVEQMQDAGLPCFAPGNRDRAVKNMKWRFRLDLDDDAARRYMDGLVDRSCENVRTVFYDSYQKMSNAIPY